MTTTRFSPSTKSFYPFDIDYSSLPADVIEVSVADFQAAMGRPDGYSFDFVGGALVITAPAAPTLDELKAANINAIQAALDAAAQAHGYDNIVSACSYAAQQQGAPFQAEGAAFLAWRSQVWALALAGLADVEAGTIPMPTPEETVAQMPALVLPA